jgi:hypothetical protein
MALQIGKALLLMVMPSNVLIASSQLNASFLADVSMRMEPTHRFD